MLADLFLWTQIPINRRADWQERKLTPEERKDIASKAASARWNIPKTTHEGDLNLGGYTIHCAVLDTGQRVLSQAQFLEALGRHRKANVRREEGDGEEPLPPILQGKAIKPFISSEIREKSRPVAFRTLSGARASGYRADLLPEVCEIYLKARDEGVLPTNQAARCEASRNPY